MKETTDKVTVVIGASNNPDRYSYKAMHALIGKGHTAIPLGIKKGEVAGIEIISGKPQLSNVHTVTLYINAGLQKEWEDYIMSLRPKRIIFNPGTENQEFFQKSIEAGISPIEGCTLVMLATNQF